MQGEVRVILCSSSSLRSFFFWCLFVLYLVSAESLGSTIAVELALRLFNVSNKISNGTDLQSPLSSKGNVGLAAHHACRGKHGHAGRGLAVLDELRDGRGRILARETAELDGSLRVARALANTAG